MSQEARSAACTCPQAGWDDLCPTHGRTAGAATASPSAHQIAYGILVAAHGEHEADDIWNEWTPAERAVVASAAERFRPTLAQAAADLVAWLRAG